MEEVRRDEPSHQENSDMTILDVLILVGNWKVENVVAAFLSAVMVLGLLMIGYIMDL